jgi:hypothetical protein
MEGQEIQDDLPGSGDFSARLLEVDGQVVAHTRAAQPNTSFNRSGVSGLLIRKTWMLLELDGRPVNSIVRCLSYSLGAIHEVRRKNPFTAGSVWWVLSG